jgi:hypothetical protein
VPEECRRDRVEAMPMANARDRWQHFSRRMPRSSNCRVACAVLFGWASLCAGCGATGLDWVGEAHRESAQQQQRFSAVHVSSSSGAEAVVIPARVEEPSSAPRPRLNRTVTLGEIDVVTTRTEAGPVTSGPPVIVNNYNQVNVTPSYGYASYGYRGFSPGFSPGHGTAGPSRPPSASGPLPGQNWPAVADHGPSFPYKSAPASPWTRTQ